ncbi:DEAD/DEAH box helicase [Clostridium botulinum]|uniref:DEAD/DEAH box helicase n=1 Tax=Clostridium botulinum TaxID=1491 RepID=A0A6M0SLD6_CLOBO|nr:DEAD/DEAH box helicase [Clostridium botulinum]
MKLRDYQITCLENIREMKLGEKKVVHVATGGGKTVIMASIAKETIGRTLIIVGQTELREQTIDKLKIICGDNVDVGSVQGDLNEIDKGIVVSTRQSLTHPKSHRMNDILENGDFEVVMIDECHQAVGQVKKIIDIVGDNCKVIGFTATPYNKEMKSIFDGFVYEKDILSLIDEGYLCQPKCFRVNTNCDISSVKTVGGEFVQSQLENAVNNDDRNTLIVKAYLEKANDRKNCIVFASGIDHATNLAKCFNVNGISAKSIDSTVDSIEREQTLNDFKEGKFKVLVNVAILTTGFDFEELECVIMARPTKSKILYTQCIGRGLRIAYDKKDCLILDIVDNVKQFNLLSCKSIFDIEDGETILEAKLRKQYEKEKHEREIEEQKRIEEEQEKLRLEEINLFNERVSNVLYSSSLDWFSTYILGEEVIILSSKINKHYAIVKDNDNEFNCYIYKNLENYKYDFELFDSNENLQELIESVESKTMNEGSSFISKNAKWKYEEATEKQVQATKGKLGINPSKWQVHKFFTSRNLFFAFKEL